MKRLIAILLLVLSVSVAGAQFAPAAGLTGSTAIWKDDDGFVEWAVGCQLNRGFQDIADTTLGLATVGDETAAVGQAATNGVVSLGDGGTAVLTFDKPIYNGDGFDFAVFENGFPTGDSSLAFLEFAFVEVSSDGVNFFRFPATSLMQDTAQLAMVGINCALYNNLAGKYVNGYGTPFDLEELKNTPGLNINAITHVKLIDVVGSVNPAYASYDNYGHAINDPYPTPYPSSGFDLDAVGVMHAVGLTALPALNVASLTVFPNPNTEALWQVKGAEAGADLFLYDVKGALLYNSTVIQPDFNLSLPDLNAGIYLLNMHGPRGNSYVKLLKE